MIFSLINVIIENGNFVSGYWIEDHTGTIESARKRVLDYEKDYKSKIALVSAVNTTTPNLQYFRNLEKV